MLRSLALPRRSVLPLALAALLTSCGDDSPTRPGVRQSRIVFTASRTTIKSELYVMNSDGSDQRRLTFNSVSELQPSWSPDGSYIVFCRSWQDSSQRWWSGIFRIQADGTNEVCIDSIADAFRVEPRVSPDGSKIVFCQMSSRFEVWVMNAAGSAAVNLTPEPEQGNHPDWSPDGARIVYARPDPMGSRIYTMKADGSDTMKVVETGVASSNQAHPRWSHDGTKIAYADDRGVYLGPYDHRMWIYVVHADGSNPTAVTPLTEGYRDSPTWSPDDRKIAYRDNFRNGSVADAEIYTIAVDGSGETNVSQFPAGHDLTPDWGPAP